MARAPGPGVEISETNYLIPDLVAVSPENQDIVHHEGLIGPPDLVVEVSSPSTRRQDLGRKRELYESLGVREYWFVDLERNEVVFFELRQGIYGEPARARGGQTVASPVLPAPGIPVRSILGS